LLPAVALALVLTCFQLLPAAWQDGLKYWRTGVDQGEYWRLLTANFVHLGWSHFLLNLAGLGFVAWLYADDRDWGSWLLALIIGGLASSLGVHWTAPGVFWMVGLSGALHGLFVFGAVAMILAGERLGWGLLLGVGVKLAYEQLVGEVPFTAAVVGGSVITAAHLWGAVGGLLAAALDYPRWRQQDAPL
jgi:rhomboid family GlyGly-CTERM serine protease